MKTLFEAANKEDGTEVSVYMATVNNYCISFRDTDSGEIIGVYHCHVSKFTIDEVIKKAQALLDGRKG